MASGEASAPGFSIYKRSTGEIRVQVGEYATAIDNTGAGEAILAGRWDDRFWYVRNGSPQPRPKLFAQEVVVVPADGITEFRVSGVPPGSMIKIDRSSWTAITDGTFEFVTAFSGEWRVEVMPAFPYQHQTVRIVAHAN